MLHPDHYRAFWSRKSDADAERHRSDLRFTLIMSVKAVVCSLSVERESGEVGETNQSMVAWPIGMFSDEEWAVASQLAGKLDGDGKEKSEARNGATKTPNDVFFSCKDKKYVICPHSVL